MPLSLLTNLKLLEFKVTMTDLKLSSVPLSTVETAQLLLKPTVALAIPAHAHLRKSIANTMLLMLLEKLSRKPPRISKEKLRREKTKRKPKLESRRLKRKPRNLRPSKNPLMKPRRSNTPSKKPSTNKKKFMPRKNKIKLSRKLESKPKKKSPKFLTIPTKLSNLKLLPMLLIKLLVKSKREPKNLRKMPPPLKLPPTKPLLTLKPPVIRLPILPKLPEKRPRKLPRVLKLKLMELKRKPRRPRIKPLISVPHQRNE